MRTVDLAREHGLSTQAIRNYEAAGALPEAERAPSGHRRYTELHAAALRAFLSLAAAHGHAVATEIMAATNEDHLDRALDLIDRSHAALLSDRAALDAVAAALTDLTAPHPPTRTPLPVGALAHRLGLRPATLRRWESEGLLVPERDRSGHRTYRPEDVRDAHLIAQLRKGGHPLPLIAPLLADLRAGAPEAVAASLTTRRAHLHTRARAMLTGAARLDDYLALRSRPTTPHAPARAHR
ncbi:MULTISPECIES: MerR family transcriptional regulator [Actinosynnema]|uniref:MerR family transcriptional regulator n=1 Tax=Actinosynnema TaxID=40566 RepID=UPI0020A5EBD5|nr:MerR family transcriptional regulator [Actinosynnema pretiosum]MCP2096235.1 DNA-binding transcriptional regulator, MerR family [Actinosynnema pretiosum]